VLKKLVAVLCFFLPSRPTRLLYRLCGHHIGKNARIPALSFVHAREMTVGNDVDIRRFVYIHVRKLSLGANTIVSYGCQIKGPAGFTCGDNDFLGLQCVIHCIEDVTLGFYSGMGPRCTVYTHGSFLPVTQGYPAKFAPVVIDDHVWIAMEVTIMPGSHIERNCIINPGVVVQGKVKPDSIVQLDARAYEFYDLNRLLKISKKNTAYWLHQIISAFLRSESLAYQYDSAEDCYSVPGKFKFFARPQTNTIELLIGNEKILYDLDLFFADQSRKPIHKKFLAFIRLHFGLTLRTRYR
jgi:acetyltransferase-like isoleucine patch superfamily enzyme